MSVRGYRYAVHAFFHVFCSDDVLSFCLFLGLYFVLSVTSLNEKKTGNHVSVKRENCINCDAARIFATFHLEFKPYSSCPCEVTGMSFLRFFMFFVEMTLCRVAFLLGCILYFR